MKRKNEPTGVMKKFGRSLRKTRGVLIMRRQDTCRLCSQSAECAELPFPGIEYSECWVCKKCWDREMELRRTANGGPSPGDGEYFPTHPWPRQRRVSVYMDILEEAEDKITFTRGIIEEIKIRERALRPRKDNEKTM